LTPQKEKQVKRDPSETSTYGILKKAFRVTVPVMFGYIPLGIAFGFLLTKAGCFWIYAVLMSILVYAGAAQFLAIGFLMNNASMAEISIATLLLNLRHSFFGLSLIRKFSGMPLVKPYLIFALTDETYALLTSMEESDQRSRPRYYLFISLFNHLYWVTGSFFGAVLGSAVAMDLKGMEFALTALFVVLAIEQYKRVRSMKPFIVGASIGIPCLIFVPPQYVLVVSIMSGTAALMAFRDGR
jgi:4-azaleucine resistance transporter AzlC